VSWRCYATYREIWIEALPPSRMRIIWVKWDGKLVMIFSAIQIPRKGAEITEF